MGLSQGQANSDSWRISKDNERYSVCDTYPSILGLPTQVTPDDLMEVAKFRSKGRVPALCWLHPQTSASITRSETEHLDNTIRYFVIIDTLQVLAAPGGTIWKNLSGGRETTANHHGRQPQLPQVGYCHTLFETFPMLLFFIRIYIYDARPKVNAVANMAR